MKVKARRESKEPAVSSRLIAAVEESTAKVSTVSSLAPRLLSAARDLASGTPPNEISLALLGTPERAVPTGMTLPTFDLRLFSFQLLTFDLWPLTFQLFEALQ